jgi:DNA topoisomerase-1
MPQKEPIFDTVKTREMIEKGRRAKWWRRKGSKSKGFEYVDAKGKKITRQEDLDRIASLVIPPAWRHVRISPSAGGRLQVVGMDTTGRIQYRYHSKYSESQGRKKFAKIEKFGEHLPMLRKRTNDDIALEGFPKEKILAVVMRLINSLYFRVGTEKSAQHYKTFGVTTLKNEHLEIGKKGELKFDFVGKSHVQHRKLLVDAELAAIMKDLKAIGPKRKLFHYLDEQGKPKPIKPGDINRYIKEATSSEFSSKDFRTWGGSLLAAAQLAEIGKAEDEKELKRNIVKAVKKVAEDLGNTPTVCRASYIHPAVLKAYEKGVTIDEFRPRKKRQINRIETDHEPEEKALLKLFKL